MLAQGQRAYHLSGTMITHSLYRPTHTAFQRVKHKRATCDLMVRMQYLFGLSTPKVYRAFAVTSKAVGSYPAFSPLLCLRQSGLFSVALAVTWL